MARTAAAAAYRKARAEAARKGIDPATFDARVRRHIAGTTPNPRPLDWVEAAEFLADLAR